MRPIKLDAMLFALVIVFFCANAYSEMMIYERSSHYNTNNKHTHKKSRAEVSYENSYTAPDDNLIYLSDNSRHSAHRSHAYSSRLSQHISAPGERVIIVDPNVHAWGAYSPDGNLLRSGLATAGSSWCRDLGRPCRTRAGSFRIYSLGSWSCVSRKFPLGIGGARMPYCMFFNGGQGLHGSYEVVAGNISHGCVRVGVGDAEWIRFNFARVGTRIIIRSY